ncbi:MAG: amidohydrolase family protein [Proteobacteria bacterium]|nr:amidohydrolase family protein [Pseudomonadota bacterium]
MKSTFIYNIGTLITGDIENPVSKEDSIYIEDGRFVELGKARRDADVIINANGLLVAPGLIDGHVHPTIGDFTLAQNSTSWVTHYLHGGITRMVSAGELHYPGLPLDRQDPKLFKGLARLTKTCYDRERPSGLKVDAGTLLLTSGLAETDFDEMVELGSKCVKFIFYPYGRVPGEDEQYVRWAKEKGLVVKIHSGGVSRSGVSVPADADLILRLGPDVVGHINGGPIPMSFEDMDRVIVESDFWLEISYAGNYRAAAHVAGRALQNGELNRVILGTDTPAGTGVTPRGMLRIMALVASLGNVPPELAICLATGNVARAHNLDSGFIHTGKPADLVIMGKIQGCQANSHLEVLKMGDLLGVSMVIIDGNIRIRERSQQTPPPQAQAVIEKE